MGVFRAWHVNTTKLNLDNYLIFYQQQIHAQQLPHGAHGPGLPIGPHPGLPGMGPAAGLLGFGAGIGAGVPGVPSGPHAAVAAGAHSLLKSADLHSREPVEIKPGSANAEERLVGFYLQYQKMYSENIINTYVH